MLVWSRCPVLGRPQAAHQEEEEEEESVQSFPCIALLFLVLLHPKAVLFLGPSERLVSVPGHLSPPLRSEFCRAPGLWPPFRAGNSGACAGSSGVCTAGG